MQESVRKMETSRNIMATYVNNILDDIQSIQYKKCTLYME